MQVDLSVNSKGTYEIWADGKCLVPIYRNKGENDKAYSDRAQRELDSYVEKYKAVMSGKPFTRQQQPRTVKSVTI